MPRDKEAKVLEILSQLEDIFPQEQFKMTLFARDTTSEDFFAMTTDSQLGILAMLESLREDASCPFCNDSGLRLAWYADKNDFIQVVCDCKQEEPS
jgi:hypothetical protein